MVILEYKGYVMNKYMKILARLSIAVVVIAFISWAIIQEPVESQEPALPQGAQIPLHIPPAVST
jgi:hypothetical protein